MFYKIFFDQTSIAIEVQVVRSSTSDLLTIKGNYR